MKRIIISAFACFGLVAPSLYAQGVLKGRVVFDGTPPPAESVEVKSDVPVCGATKETTKIVLSADKGVANVVVKVLGATGTASSKKGSLDQVKCEFNPHVQVVPTGSTLGITSSDAVLHNSHGFYEDGSTAFNLAVPVVGMEISKKLDKPGVIKLRCDAGHTWMGAYVVVLDEPFYALTDANGNFSIEGIPPGHYDLEIWQEWLGKTKQPVDIKEGPNDLITITLKESK